MSGYTLPLFLLMSGAVGGFGFPPYYIFPFTLLSYGTFFLFLYLRSDLLPSKIFLSGWLWGTAYFVSNLWWTGTALLIDENPFLWALPLAVVGFPSLLGFFPAFAALLFFFSRKLWLNKPLNAALIFALWIGFSEYGRGYFFTGFPWNIPAYIWSDFLPLLQSLSLIGPFALSLLTIALSSLVATCLFAHQRRQTVLILSGLCILLVSLSVWGSLRLQNNPTEYKDSNTIVRLLQPNIPQAQKWNRDTYDQQIDTITKLLTQPLEEKFQSTKTVFAIAPETALNETMLSSVHAFETIDTAFLRLQSLPQEFYFYTGILRSEIVETEGVIEKRNYNSSLLFNESGEVIDIYDKFHLVPFGEYMPYSNIIPIEPVVKFSGFEFGDGLKTLKYGNLPAFSPLICYEILFPAEVVVKDDRPEIMVNITNDAWYGNSPGPYQHVLQAQYRAIEEGIPVARAANTGMSVIYDAYGRKVVSLSLFKEGVIDSYIPQISSERTLYSKTGNLPYFLLSFLFLLFPFLRTLTNKN